jgi:ADP-ribose pyrophosphatase YjhB (NUDIX family)
MRMVCLQMMMKSQNLHRAGQINLSIYTGTICAPESTASGIPCPVQTDNSHMDTRWKPNVTVAAIIEKDGRYMLIEEHTQEGLRLNNPAGHLDEGESPADGCAREALEETAHPFKPTALVGIYLSRFQRAATGEDITYVRMAFCGDIGDLQPHLSLDQGIVRTLWMTPEEVRASTARHRSPLVLRCIEDHLAGQRFPLSVVYTDPAVSTLPS